MERRLEEEEVRVSKYLHDDTRSKLQRTLCDVLIKSYLDSFNAEVKVLLEEERKDGELSPALLSCLDVFVVL